MRGILFRGKSIDTGGWIEGFYNYRDYMYNGEDVRRHYILPPYEQDSIVVDPGTVGQYTGLKDKNGKKIFGGDVIKENDVIHNGELQYEGLSFVVAYINGCWFAIRKNRSGERKAMFLGGCCDVSEVIGNIHDNPELMGGAENVSHP